MSHNALIILAVILAAVLAAACAAGWYEKAHGRHAAARAADEAETEQWIGLLRAQEETIPYRRTESQPPWKVLAELHHEPSGAGVQTTGRASVPEPPVGPGAFEVPDEDVTFPEEPQPSPRHSKAIDGVVWPPGALWPTAEQLELERVQQQADTRRACLLAIEAKRGA